MTRTVLVVEDEAPLRAALRRYLTRAGMEILEARTNEEAFGILESRRLDVVLTDVHLPDGMGFEVADCAASQRPAPGVVVMTGDDRVDTAIAALHCRVADFLLKPFSFDALEAAIRRADPRHGGTPPASAPIQASSNRAMADWRARHAPAILGSHPSLMQVFAIIERVCDTDCSVLITGESGTGKELVARCLHDASQRADKPFVTVNCAAIPDNLLESELFGHTRGAFTGATASRIGRFTAADKGTLFLDELGELPLPLQAKLLRVLQEKEVTPVGESRCHKVDVRVVTATNRDLDDMVKAGRFREDLLYRIQVVPVELPALRERRQDIPGLAAHFIQRTNERRSRQVTGATPEAMDALCAYDWPGNIRQLANTIERMVLLCSQDQIGLADVPSRIQQADGAAPGGSSAPPLPEQGIDLKDAVERFENGLILQALERTGWNKNRAAAVLRMKRTTLVEKMKKRNLTVQDVVVH